MIYYIIPVTLFSQNCSLVCCKQTGESILVDPGGESHKLRQKITMLRLTIKEIWLTHGHLDHVGAARELADFYNVPIIGPHYDENYLLENLPIQCTMFGVKIIPPFKPDRWLADGTTLNVGKLSFLVLHCPGHSPGHVVFYNKSTKFILMGDVLFNGGIGRTDLLGGNFFNLIRSIRQKIKPLADDITFLPGHGPLSTLGCERKINYLLQ